MIRRPPRSTQSRSSAASDVYKRQLITIIIYSFVIHSRMIPGMKDIYTFNLLSLFAISSVLMTYFGVNYYLTGLHSYAGGDPVPVPFFVYVAIAVLVSLAVMGWVKYRKWERK